MGIVSNIRASLQPYFPSLGGLIQQTDQRSGNSNTTRDLSRYISPVQLDRIRQDVQTWRNAIREAENAWYPHRVKMQQMYIDTVLNGHVEACMTRRHNLTLSKDYNFVNKSSKAVDKKTNDILKGKKWFRLWQEYQIQKHAYGYSLPYFGSIVNSEFPDLSIVRRYNISPDRLNVTQFIYSISGAPFLEEPFADWHCWLTTPTDVGASKVGYGYLYKVAFYEIVARNVLTQNLDATEMYGAPLRVGKTNKSQDDPERAVFEAALAELGSAGYMLMDAVGDEVQLVESKSLGNGYKIYESLEGRAEKKISKIILGHADAMDSVPGKLGSGQGGEESPATQAMNAVAAKDQASMCDDINNILLPKLRNLGFIIPEDTIFEFDGAEEEVATRKEDDENNKLTADIFQVIKNAGGDPDWAYFTKRTGIPVTKAEPLELPGAPGLPGMPQTKPGEKKPTEDKPKDKAQKIKDKLEKIYGRHKH